MIFNNALVFTPEGRFLRGGFAVENGRFTGIFTAPRPGGRDLQGARVLPGLVDIHVHGAAGADFSDGSPRGLRDMAAYLAAHGVTAFAPTSMSLPLDGLAAAFTTAEALRRDPPAGCARVLGIHMEGPFLSEARKGAQNGAYLRAPDAEAFRALNRGCGGLIRIVEAAPELPGAAAFAREAAGECVVSAGHTDADYDAAGAMFDAGATHLTHLFNAMTPFRHRAPGVIAAASERENVTAELICDGRHVHPAAVRMAFRLFPGRICLVSDALRCCGMPEGEYELAGQTVVLRDGAARLPDGTLAGSASDLFECMLNAVRFGIAPEEAILSATLRPARVIGAETLAGSIAPGLAADFLVCGPELELREVWLGGERLR